MAKRADADHTPERPPLDDDARWLAIEAAHQRRADRPDVGDVDLAIIDLMKVLEQDRLPCMVRSTVTGERKLIEAMAWRDQIELLWSRRDGLLVVHRRHPREPDANIVKPFRGGRFFVWQLALDRLWPPPAGRAPVEHADASDAPSRVKPGPKPQDDWPTLIAQWLIEVAVDDPKRLQNVDALVIEAKLFLHNQTGRAPKENKELRDKIRELLERVRR